MPWPPLEAVECPFMRCDSRTVTVKLSPCNTYSYPYFVHYSFTPYSLYCSSVVNIKPQHSMYSTLHTTTGEAADSFHVYMPAFSPSTQTSPTPRLGHRGWTPLRKTPRPDCSDCLLLADDGTCHRVHRHARASSACASNRLPSQRLSGGAVWVAAADSFATAWRERHLSKRMVTTSHDTGE